MYGCSFKHGVYVSELSLKMPQRVIIFVVFRVCWEVWPCIWRGALHIGYSLYKMHVFVHISILIPVCVFNKNRIFPKGHLRYVVNVMIRTML